MNKMSSNTKRNPPYVKKEDKKKTEAKNKLKGTIVIHPLPFVISMTTTIITINVKGRVTPGSPWTEFIRWCANVE